MSNYLEDVPEDKVFYLKDRKIKNLYGLLFEFRTLSDDTYGYYADSNHNYFSDWIENVIGNKDISDALRKSKSRQDAVKILEKKIEDLKKNKERDPVWNKEVITIEEPKDIASAQGSFVVSDPEGRKKENNELKKEK